MNSKTITIRPTKESDYDVVAELVDYEYREYHKHLPDDYRESKKEHYRRGSFIDALEDKEMGMFVAEIDGKVVGAIDCYIDESEDNPTGIVKGCKYVEVNHLAVFPEYQRRGVGTALVKEVEKWIAEQGFSESETLVCDFNTPMKEFFLSLNYIPRSIKMTKQIKQNK